MNRRISTLFLFVLALLGSLVYFREYIIAIGEGFSNFILTCGDFGQYSYEAYIYSHQKFLINILVPDKEPGIFLVTTILTSIVGLSSPVALILVTFVGQFVLLFAVGSIARKIIGKNIYGIIGVLLAITIFQLSYVYLQLISRQLFSTAFLVLASNLYFSGYKKISHIFVIGLCLSMSFISHRFGGVISLGAIILSLLTHIFKFHKINYSYFLLIFLIVLMTGPFIYFISKYAFIINTSKKDIFLSQEIDLKNNTFNGGFSYLASSGNIQDIPILHYFFYQSFYLIFVIAHLLFLVKHLTKKKSLFTYIFLTIFLYCLVKITFSIRALVSFEVFLIPIIASSFYLNKNKNFKLLVLFSFILIGIYGFTGRMPITFKKVIPKDSSIIFIENNFELDSSLFLSPNRCDSDVLTQLFYFTSENLGNDNLAGIHQIEEKDILSYAFVKVIAERNYNTLVQGSPYLHEIFKGKQIYIFFGRYTNQVIVNSLKDRSHMIFQLPYASLTYENPQAKIVKYIFKIDISKMNFFDNGYYLRNLR